MLIFYVFNVIIMSYRRIQYAWVVSAFHNKPNDNTIQLLNLKEIIYFRLILN